MLLDEFLFLLVCGKLQDFSHVVSVEFEVSSLVSFKGSFDIFQDTDSIDKEVFFKNFKMFGWVDCNVNTLFKLVKVENTGVNGFAGRKSLLELLNCTN